MSTEADITIDEQTFEDAVPQNTVYVKWDVKGGRDRTHNPRINTDSFLEGSPNIQGVEIRSSSNVNLKIWGNHSPSGNPDRVVQGPTNGKIKIDPRRYASYRVEPR